MSSYSDNVTLLLNDVYRPFAWSRDPHKFDFLLKNYDTLHICQFPYFILDHISEDECFGARMLEHVVDRDKKNWKSCPDYPDELINLARTLEMKLNAHSHLVFVVNKWRDRYINNTYQFQDVVDRMKYNDAVKVLAGNAPADSLMLRLSTITNTDPMVDAQRFVIEHEDRVTMLIETEYLKHRFETAILQAKTQWDVNKVMKELRATTNYFV